MSTSPSSPHSFVIYGAGNKGREICNYLRQTGYLVSAFIDTHAQPDQTSQGLPVFSPTAWLAGHAPASFSAIVAIHNYSVEMVPLMSDIRAMGFAETLNVVDFYNRFPKALPDHYWLTDSGYFPPFAESIASLRNLLADENSRQLLDAIMQFRNSGDYGKLPPPQFGDQYRPMDLEPWKNPLRFIDCGAFTGDTLDHMRNAGYDFEAIAAFEPDTNNYRALVAHIRSQPDYATATCFPCGVAATAGMLSFNADQGMASAISDHGNTSIQCVSIDEALIGFQPNLIKMDIEGAEPDALLGARKTIETSRPGLAISLYHHPAHLWQIPLLIDSWQLNYSLFIRQHAYNTYELVLYAIPNSATIYQP